MSFLIFIFNFIDISPLLDEMKTRRCIVRNNAPSFPTKMFYF